MYIYLAPKRGKRRQLSFGVMYIASKYVCKIKINLSSRFTVIMHMHTCMYISRLSGGRHVANFCNVLFAAVISANKISLR
jgi:hypothetical protein